ncbi:MAG: MFS transporter [Phycisphaerales bacterium]|nr:MFS transporter [Phycisphaerales bacterium]
MTTVFKKKSLFTIVLTAVVGTIIEWYDLLIFAILMPYIADTFLPIIPGATGKNTRYLLTLITFFITFLCRPLGSFFFGPLGDKRGRKAPFLVSLVLMLIGSIGIACLPSFKMIGYWAPVLLIIFRIVQGFAVSGEFAAAAVTIGEHSPINKRAQYISMLVMSPMLTTVVAIWIYGIAQRMMSPQTFADGGWRLLFLVTLFLFPLSYYIRKEMTESQVFLKARGSLEVMIHPIKQTFKKENFKKLLLFLLTFGIGGGITIACYLLLPIFYLEHIAHIAHSQAEKIIVYATLIMAPFYYLFAYISDRLQIRKPIIVSALILALIFIPYLYQKIYEVTLTHVVVATPNTLAGVLLTADGFKWILLLLTLIGIIVGLFNSIVSSFFCEEFPTTLRNTSLAFIYNIGVGIFSSLVPILLTYYNDQAVVANTKALAIGQPIPYPYPSMEGFTLWKIVLATCCVIVLLYHRSNRQNKNGLEY